MISSMETQNEVINDLIYSLFGSDFQFDHYEDL